MCPLQGYERQFLDALGASLRGLPAPSCPRTEEDWRALLRLSAEQKVLPMIYDALAAGARASGGIGPALGQARVPVLRSAAEQARKSLAFLELCRALRDASLQALVVKGILCRSLYPKPDLRPSADEDLYVRAKEFVPLRDLLLSLGFQPLGDTARDTEETAYRDPGSGLYVEVHRHLVPGDAAAYRRFNAPFLTAFDRAEETTVEDTPLWTLCPQDHLLYLILHSCKHFLHSGFGVRQVCDICLFASAQRYRLDWEQLFSSLEAVQAGVFAANIFQIGREYLGLALPDGLLSQMERRNGALDCVPLLEDLLSAGVYGGSSEARRHSSLITLHAAESCGRPTGGVLRAVFPRRDTLKGVYPYLEEQPWLLPAAWVHRLGRYALGGPGRGASARESVGIGTRRVALLRKYRVIP